MESIVDFQADLKQFSQLLDVRVAKLMRYVTLELFGQIVLRWPVDTGYSRANWRIGVGEPDLTVTAPPPDAARGKGRQIYGPPDVDFTELESIDGTQPVFITNSVPYAIYLEEGHSQQAPNGVVRISVAQLEANIDQIVEQAKRP
jgi:hypothetical protein